MEELISLRKPKEKYFLNKNGTITAYVYDSDVHYLDNGVYKEISNEIEDKGEYFSNEKNSFQTFFYKQSKDLFRIKKDDYYLTFYVKDSADLKLNKKINLLNYKNVVRDVDFNYKIMPSKLKESIILNCRETIPEKLEFIVDTNLNLEIDEKQVLAKGPEGVVLTIAEPYMMDAKGNRDYCINYELQKVDEGYLLSIALDTEWLRDPDVAFPVIIDPTIINDKNEVVYDSFISSNAGDTNFNSSETLELGVESNTTKRILLKFPLPEIGTGFDVIDATCFINSYKYDIQQELFPAEIFADVHQVTKDWDEKNVTWNTIHDSYNPIIEDYFAPYRTLFTDYPEPTQSTFNITNLVKKWYSGVPNYGIMIKLDEEVYNPDVKPYRFSSKTYDALNQATYRSYLAITYRNQNGIENYLTYKTQSFKTGSASINNLTGNLTTQFELLDTLSGKYPIALSLFYNTNDVVLKNNFGYGNGFKLNLHETIKEVTLGSAKCLEFLDEDGTVHYFILSDDKYYDEDGLGLSIELENDKYVMLDSDGNKSTYSKNGDTWYLTSVVDSDNNSMSIDYDSMNRIIKITDGDGNFINFTYEANKLTIISDYAKAVINYEDNKVVSIETVDGIISFYYNDKNIISRIKDITGTGYAYEYYDVIPYKIKKVSEIGVKDNIGKSLEYSYGFKVTRVKDQDGICNTYAFNTRGNTISVTNLDEKVDLNNALGKNSTYNQDATQASKVVNSLEAEQLPIRFVRNLISNSSFESECLNRTNETARTGQYSYKIVGSDYIEYDILPDNDYTFSGYFKNASPLKLTTYVIGVEGTSYNGEIVIPANEEFTRYEFTFYANNTRSRFAIEYNVENNDVVYLDDVQLEVGQVANYYNIIDNPCFTSGFDTWDVTSRIVDENYNEIDVSDRNEIVKIGDNINAAKLISGPRINTDLYKMTRVTGKKGDIYNVSFWYKNEGVMPSYNYNLASVVIGFDYGEEYVGPGEPGILDLNYHADEWQFFSGVFVAEDDYIGVYLDILYLNNVNSLYITNLVLSRDIEQDTIGYDYNSGKMTSFRNMGGSTSELVYDKNNQLTSIFNPRGDNYKYEYDNIKKTRLLREISPTGISNEIKYDTFGNPIKTIINNVNPDNELIEGHKYHVRLKGTNKYFDVNYITNEVSFKEDNCNPDYFEVSKVDDYYKFSIANRYLNISNNTLVLANNSTNTDSELFKLESNSNGSFKIIPKSNEELCLNVENEHLVLKEIGVDDYNQEFYFEDTNTPLFIEEKAEYTKDGKYVTRITDTLGKQTEYDVNYQNGKPNSITDASGVTSYYTYDEHNRQISISRNNKTVEYEYNANNLISKIKTPQKQINYLYDDFLNIKEIDINNVKVIGYTYDDKNSGLVITNYANGDSVEFSYDELNRMKTMLKNDKLYSYYYDSLGNLAKIVSNNELYCYYYDLAQRISKFVFENIDKFVIDYDYDVNNNVVKKVHKLNDILNEVSYEYNKDNGCVKVSFKNDNVNYVYDYLGRLVSKDINGNNKMEYIYASNGNKTSLILKAVKVNNNVYEYHYDNLYNITDIYLNDELINHYEYDEFNELIKEDNYQTNITIKYTYDIDGNIQNKSQYVINSETLINTVNYLYNPDYKDQLIKYNNEDIKYDATGNPISIGNATLKWNNGRELLSLVDNSKNLNIKYENDIEGLRIRKTLNNVEHKYYYEDNKLIYEQFDNNLLYFIRDKSGDLIGFTYNGVKYYYLKNAFEDIIGILDENFNVVVNYSYDSWGKPISVTDSNGNEITDTNNLAFINPFRYRSYYYDNETGLYYLNRRYYNPEWGRFINPDIYVDTNQDSNSTNMYVYTNNNPVSCVDIDGELWWTVVKIGWNVVTSMAAQWVDNKINNRDKFYHMGRAFTAGLVEGVCDELNMGFVGTVASTVISNIGNDVTPIELVEDVAVNYTIKKAVDKIPRKRPGRNPVTLKASLIGKKSMNKLAYDTVTTFTQSAVSAIIHPTDEQKNKIKQVCNEGKKIVTSIIKKVKSWFGWK